MAERMDERERPDGLVVRDEIARQEERLVQLATAKAVREERARERDALGQAARCIPSSGAQTGHDWRLPQLPQGLALNLAHALACDAQTPPDLIEPFGRRAV